MWPWIIRLPSLCPEHMLILQCWQVSVCKGLGWPDGSHSVSREIEFRRAGSKWAPPNAFSLASVPAPLDHMSVVCLACGPCYQAAYDRIPDGKGFCAALMSGVYYRKSIKPEVPGWLPAITVLMEAGLKGFDFQWDLSLTETPDQWRNIIHPRNIVIKNATPALFLDGGGFGRENDGDVKKAWSYLVPGHLGTFSYRYMHRLLSSLWATSIK